MYETECRHVAVPLEVSRTRTIYSIETHTSDFIFNTLSLSTFLFFLLQNCRPSDELSFSVYGPSSLYCLRGSNQFMSLHKQKIKNTVFKQNPKSRIWLWWVLPLLCIYLRIKWQFCVVGDSSLRWRVSQWLLITCDVSAAISTPSVVYFLHYIKPRARFTSEAAVVPGRHVSLPVTRKETHRLFSISRVAV